MVGTHRLCSAVLVVAVIGGCLPGPAPEKRPQPEPVESPTPYESQPAVIALIERSRMLVGSNRPQEAAAQLDRALRIDPRDPALLQERAERFLADGEASQALNYAEKSFQRSVKRGALCRRNWQTIEAARSFLGDRAGAREARQRALFC